MFKAIIFAIYFCAIFFGSNACSASEIIYNLPHNKEGLFEEIGRIIQNKDKDAKIVINIKSDTYYVKEALKIKSNNIKINGNGAKIYGGELNYAEYSQKKCNKGLGNLFLLKDQVFDSKIASEIYHGKDIKSGYPVIFSNGTYYNLSTSDRFEIESRDGGVYRVSRNFPEDGVFYVKGKFGKKWSEEIVRVFARRNESTFEVLDLPTYGYKIGDLFSIINYKELNEGDWFFDENHIYVCSRDVASFEYSISFLDEVLKIDNSENISITNINIFGAKNNIIDISDSKSVHLDGIKIIGAGMHGVLVKNSNGVELNNSFVDKTGLSSVSLSNNSFIIESRITGNSFRGYGLLQSTYRPAIAIYGKNVRVEGNVIDRGDHSAIIFHGAGHLIYKNIIYNPLMDSGDSGAIYSGRDLLYIGNRIIGNSIYGNKFGGPRVGIYLDDQLSNTYVADNYIENFDIGILVGGGKYNKLVGNKLKNVAIPYYVDARGVTWQKGRAERDAKIAFNKILPEDFYYFAMKINKNGLNFMKNIGEPVFNVIENNCSYENRGAHVDPYARSYINIIEEVLLCSGESLDAE